jgi:putative ABC transport system permease protein
MLSVVAVALEVTLMLTLVGMSHGMLEDSRKRAKGVGADIIVRPPGSSVLAGSTAPMSEKVAEFVAKQPQVAMATPVFVFPLQGFLNSVTGIDFEAFSKMSGGFTFLSGGPFRKPDDVIVDRYYAQQNKLKVGSPMKMMNQAWRVCGIVESGKGGRIFLPIQLLQEKTSNVGRINQVYAKAANPKVVDGLVTQLRGTLAEYQIYSMEEFTSLISVDQAPGLRPFLNVIVGIAAVIGFLVVFLSMYTAVLERTREVGILKSLGATPTFITALLARETLILAAAGSVLGIIFSYGTRWLIQTLVPASLQQAIVMEWWPIASGIAVVGALLGALYPAWKASRQDTIEALAYD